MSLHGAGGPHEPANAQAGPSGTGAELPWERHSTYFLTNAFYLVQGCLFSVPRCLFENGSEVFRDMYQLPPTDDSVAEGSTAQNPLRLEGIEKLDFEQLLRVLLPLHPGQPQTLTVDEWKSVIKLSTMWNFEALRALAITELSAMQLNPIDKYLLATEYHVNESDWLVPALVELVVRKEPMGEPDAARLGLRTTLLVAQVREECARDPAMMEDVRPGRRACGSCGSLGIIQKVYPSSEGVKNVMECFMCGRVTSADTVEPTALPKVAAKIRAVFHLA